MHRSTEMCAKGLKRILKQPRDEEAQAIKEVAFQVYGRTLEMVTVFKYLGRVINA